jgi:hypothetical protein
MIGAPMPPEPEDRLAAYVVDGSHVEPTGYARGPWFGEQQHGACVLGLLTRFLEQMPSYAPMRLTRITADLSRPVPVVPFVVETRALRDGRRVQSLEASFRVGDDVVSRAVATRIRVEPGLIADDVPPQPGPEDTAPPLAGASSLHGLNSPCFQDCLETRELDEFDGHKGRYWFRLKGRLVAGEDTSPTVLVASVADNMMSSVTRLGEGWITINPEVSLQLERLPAGEWICIESTVRFDTEGIGMSEGVLFDRTGRIGRAAKSTLNYRAERER